DSCVSKRGEGGAARPGRTIRRNTQLSRLSRRFCMLAPRRAPFRSGPSIGEALVDAQLSPLRQPLRAASPILWKLRCPPLARGTAAFGAPRPAHGTAGSATGTLPARSRNRAGVHVL